MARGSSARLLQALAQRRDASTAPGAKALTLLALKARREELGITQEQMSKRLGCARETFCKLENDERSPESLDFLFRWAAALGGAVGVTFAVTGTRDVG